jgi:VWFA-related protein
VCAGFVALIAASVLAQAPVPPQFRSGTALVPIDVRAIDKAGRAVTDLTAADFRVTENRVPQVITQFTKQVVGETPARRAFVLVLGEGRVQAPFKSIDALIRFVQTALGPTDVVGVIGYNRWVDFTTNRGLTIAVLERFKSRNDRIQTALETHFSGAMLDYGSPDIPDSIQRQIDDVFQVPEGPGLREFAPPTRLGVAIRPGSSHRFTTARFSDIVHVYGAIDYLLQVEGEKHLILLSEQGPPSQPKSRSRLGMIAADARVALHIVQTGGVGEARRITDTGFFGQIPNVSPWSSVHHAGARALSEHTGGLTFWYTDADKALTAVAAATRVNYLLGYVPTNTEWKGEYRDIGVTVTRPGVTLLFRHGYHATTVVPRWDDRATMTELRMAEARAASRLPRQLPLSIVAKLTKSPSGEKVVEVALDVEPSAVEFAIVDGRHAARLDVALWVMDGKGAVVGSLAEIIQLRLTDASFAALVSKHIAYTGSVRFTGTPRSVRAVVYDYDADRVGAAVQQIR